MQGTHVLLEACKGARPTVRRFIHVSTDKVYGETEADAIVGNHEGSQLLLPTNPYSATKAGAEMLVMAYGRSYDLPVVTTCVIVCMVQCSSLRSSSPSSCS
ncbi:hypothetical protein HHK36_013764 [Tetracentron sinense]|uniref:NAD(P)-binding domain-containing protein n=1 Tax=Tetracentron sinense TaxID=13715 RepID=A0A834Z7N8_TETSI|nr:hypothetical protein HHK36_013764 [Tetracentron sinense]